MEAAAEPRSTRGQGLAEAMREDLEPYGVDELETRVTVLEAEIVRVRAQIDRKKAGRAAADSFFKS